MYDLFEALNRAHELDEAQETGLEIPTPFDKYYELSSEGVDPDKLPTAFNNYDMTVLAAVRAKNKYEDALAKNGLEACWLADGYGRQSLVTTVARRVYYVDIGEVERCVSDYFDNYEPAPPVINKSSDKFIAYKRYLGSLCRELKKTYQLVMSRKQNAGIAQQSDVFAVVKCDPESYVPFLTIELDVDSLDRKIIEGLKLTANVSEDATTIHELLMKHVNTTSKLFWVEYDKFIQQVKSLARSARYMKDLSADSRTANMEYRDDTDRSMSPVRLHVSREASYDVAGADVIFCPPTRAALEYNRFSRYDYEKLRAGKKRRKYESSELNTALEDIKQFLARYDVPANQLLNMTGETDA